MFSRNKIHASQPIIRRFYSFIVNVKSRKRTDPHKTQKHTTELSDWLLKPAHEC